MRFFPALLGAILITVAIFMFMQSLIKSRQEQDVVLPLHTLVEVPREEPEQEQPEPEEEPPEEGPEEEMSLDEISLDDFGLEDVIVVGIDRFQVVQYQAGIIKAITINVDERFYDIDLEHIGIQGLRFF